jgi:plastocyanin
MKLISALVTWSLLCLNCFAGEITGMVCAEGVSGTDSDLSSAGAYASRKYKFAQQVDYAAMRDFVVFLEGEISTNNAVSTNVTVVATTRIAQQGALFSPHVLPVMAGTTVEWPNNDQICHNVFSMSDAKQFDLGLYKGNPPSKRVTFDKPGRVDVYCSIHSNMHCVVLVLENPYFASTDSKGHYAIKDVPSGTYKIKAWHERLPADEQDVFVSTNGEAIVNFTLGIKNLPKY